MTSKKTTDAKTTKPEPEMLHTSDVAAMLKIDGKVLRKHLRAINGKATGQRYEWKPNDPFLKKLPELIKAQEEKDQAAKKKA